MPWWTAHVGMFADAVAKTVGVDALHPALHDGRHGESPQRELEDHRARAEELREPLRLAMEALGRAVSPAAPFDPALAQNTWRVAASDYGESTILLTAMAGLRAAAPGTRLAVLELAPPQIARQAEQGMRHRLLFKERYVLAGRVDHPRLKRRPTLKQLCELEHVIVSPDGGGFSGITDATLAQAGLSRRVVLSVPHFLFVIAVLGRSDLVAMLPERLVRGNPALHAVAPPIDAPGYEMAMLWPERVHRDPAHQWLRDLLGACI